MRKTTEKRIRYEILETVIEILAERKEEYKRSAEMYLRVCTDEETCEISEDKWEFGTYLEYKDKEEVCGKLIDEIEKM